MAKGTPPCDPFRRQAISELLHIGDWVFERQLGAARSGGLLFRARNIDTGAAATVKVYDQNDQRKVSGCSNALALWQSPRPCHISVAQALPRCPPSISLQRHIKLVLFASYHQSEIAFFARTVAD
jgi:hypothetical protein